MPGGASKNQAERIHRTLPAPRCAALPRFTNHAAPAKRFAPGPADDTFPYLPSLTVAGAATPLPACDATRCETSFHPGLLCPDKPAEAHRPISAILRKPFPTGLKTPEGTRKSDSPPAAPRVCNHCHLTKPASPRTTSPCDYWPRLPSPAAPDADQCNDASPCLPR
jgi:hypothetical protein